MIVNLKSGEAIRGILTTQRGPLIEVRQAELLERGRPPVPLDGSVVIERTHVTFVQVVGEPAAIKAV